VVRQPYSGREVALLARDHAALLDDDYDIASLVEAIEYRRKREVGNMLMLAQLFAWAYHDPKHMPSIDDLLYEKQPAPPPTRDEWNALKARMKG
jgi:hypothetical protein